MLIASVRWPDILAQGPQIFLESVIIMEITKKRNLIITLLLLMCIGLWAGIYWYRTQSTLQHYQTAIPTDDAVQNIKLVSGGSNVNLTSKNTDANTIDLSSYVTPAFLKQDEIIQKEATALNLNFIKSQGHSFFNHKQTKTPAIQLTIPVSAPIKTITLTTNGGDVDLNNISQMSAITINTNGGDVHLNNISQMNTITINTKGGNVYLNNQDVLTFNHHFATNGGTNAFAESGRGNVNHGGTLIITTNGGDIIRNK